MTHRTPSGGLTAIKWKVEMGNKESRPRSRSAHRSAGSRRIYFRGSEAKGQPLANETKFAASAGALELGDSLRKFVLCLPLRWKAGSLSIGIDRTFRITARKNGSFTLN